MFYLVTSSAIAIATSIMVAITTVMPIIRAITAITTIASRAYYSLDLFCIFHIFSS